MSGDLTNHPAILGLQPERQEQSGNSLNRWLLGVVATFLLGAAYLGINSKLEAGSESLRRTQAMELRMAVLESATASQRDETNRRFDELKYSVEELNRKMDRLLSRGSGTRQGDR